MKEEIMIPTRTEKLNFKMKLTKKEYENHKALLNQIGKLNLNNVQEGDNVSFTYTVVCEYFGAVAQKLEILLNLMSKGVIIKASAEELNYGKSLIQEIFKSIEKLQEKIT